MKKLKIGILVALAAMVAIVFFQNQEPVKINLLFWHVYTSKLLAFFIILATGFIIGTLTFYLQSKK